jgi:hypothetical protein
MAYFKPGTPSEHPFLTAVSPVSRDFGRKSQFRVEKNISGCKEQEQLKKNFSAQLLSFCFLLTSIMVMIFFYSPNFGRAGLYNLGMATLSTYQRPNYKTSGGLDKLAFLLKYLPPT